MSERQRRADGHGGGSRRQHSHHGSHHHHSLMGRLKRGLRRHKWLGPAVLLSAAIVIAGVFWMLWSLRSQHGLSVTAGAQFNAGSGYRDIIYRGKAYRYNSRITSILYAGVDSDGELAPSKQYTAAPRADSICLVVLDEFNHRMTIVALSRDTMTKIHKFTLSGKDRGRFTDHLGYAYTYGEGGAVSCSNLCGAVSDLLYGVPVNEYVVTNRSSLPILSDVIGAVDLIVPNDDLSGAGYFAGESISVDAGNIELFVRSRDTAEDFSNAGRMQRQQAYINGAVEQIRALLGSNPSAAWRKMEAAEDCMQTNITRSRYLDLAKVLQNTSYDQRDYYIPEGRQVAASDHDEFYPDEEALLERVIEIFYIEK